MMNQLSLILSGSGLIFIALSFLLDNQWVCGFLCGQGLMLVSFVAACWIVIAIKYFKRKAPAQR